MRRGGGEKEEGMEGDEGEQGEQEKEVKEVHKKSMFSELNWPQKIVYVTLSNFTVT